MTSQFDIDCRHYGDRKLDKARLVDINDHQESTEHHRQQTVRQTTETPQRLKRVIVSWIELEKHEKERHKFHNLLSSLGFEPSNQGVVVIVANH